jgi:hypothetical protein
MATCRFLKQAGARYVRLIQEDLPINPLIRHQNPTENAQVAYEIANLIRCFAPQLGAKQERNVSDCYQRLTDPDFPSLALELENSGATGVDLAIIQKIERFNLFASAQTAIPPERWLETSLVIDFKGFHTDSETKALAASLILNFLIKKLGQQLAVKKDVQPLKMVLFVDEAHLLLPKEHKAGLLSQLARQGRSWGFPVWPASQDADKFLTTGTNETNFAQLAECGVHFSPRTPHPASGHLRPIGCGEGNRGESKERPRQPDQPEVQESRGRAVPSRQTAKHRNGAAILEGGREVAADVSRL